MFYVYATANMLRWRAPQVQKASNMGLQDNVAERRGPGRDARNMCSLHRVAGGEKREGSRGLSPAILPLFRARG